MSRYTYQQRAIGTTRAQRPARAAETGLSVANSIALYERPVCVHSGPSPMRMGESFDIAYPWPWVRLDTAAGVPTRLDEATVWLLHTKGTLDVSLRLVGICSVNPEADEDPGKMPSSLPCLITVELLQYVAGSTTPATLATQTIEQDIICYPDAVTPWYPLLSILSMGALFAKTGYNKDIQTYQGGGLLRVGQLYPPDLALLQRVRLSCDFGDAGWSPNFDAWRTNPCFVRVTCVRNTLKTPVWEPLATQNYELVRIFCVGSEMSMRGRL